MAIVDGGIGQFLSGSIEGLVFVKGKGRTYLRSMPRARKANEWTDKQKEARNGFREVVRLAAGQKQKVIVPIWNKAAEHLNMSGYNLFIKSNRAAFDAQGNLSHPEMLHFSTGSLALPYRLWAERDAHDPGAIAVSWTDQLAGSSHGDDCLMALIYQNGEKELVNTGFTRKEEKAVLINPAPEATDVFLYLFFWNKPMDTYSDDQAFAIK